MFAKKQAYYFNVPVERPLINETTALGAVYLAGLAVGFWKNREEIAGQWQMDRCFEQQMTTELSNELYSGWKKAVNATLASK